MPFEWNFETWSIVNYLLVKVVEFLNGDDASKNVDDATKNLDASKNLQICSSVMS